MDALNHWAQSWALEITWLEICLALAACAVAMLLGTWLAKRQAHVYERTSQGELPQVNHVDYGDLRFMHLGTPWVQGSMKISKPYEIHLEYVQRMMGWMLLTDLDQVHHLRSMQMGLGAASLTKFCHLQLGMHTTAVELNPEVIETCRRWFNLPNDNAKLQVLLADAAELASLDSWHATIDVLQVDLYDQEAACPAIDSEAFYADCRELLTEQGCMAVNLYGRDSSLEVSMQRLTKAFGMEALWAFKPTSAGNTIVLAFRTPRSFDKSALLAQAQIIQKRWSLPATKWLKTLAPARNKENNSGT